jgi:ABC-type transport system involved in multi-copper enzyme maturation permease subunit
MLSLGLLKRITSYLLKHWKLSLLAGAVLFSLFIMGLSSLNSPTTQGLDRLSFAYAEIQPGSTTHKELIETAGLFESEYAENGYMVYTYHTGKSRYAPDRFYLRNDVVELKELNFNPIQYELGRERIIRQFGRPTSSLYDQVAVNFGIITEVLLYPKESMAVYVRTDSNMVTKIHFFAGSDAEAYTSKWGKNLATVKPTLPEQEKHTD